jgi:hypothetical protein
LRVIRSGEENGSKCSCRFFFAAALRADEEERVKLTISELLELCDRVLLTDDPVPNGR